MPIVRPTFIPNQFQPLPTAAQGFGGAGGQLVGKLLAALLSQLGQNPTRGQFTATTGATTPISPAERTTQGGVPLATLLQTSKNLGAITPDQFQAGGFRGILQRAFPPDISGQVQQAQLTQSRQSTRQTAARFPLQQQQLEASIAQTLQETENLNEGDIQTIGFLNGQLVPVDTQGATIFELKKTKQGARLGQQLSSDLLSDKLKRAQLELALRELDNLREGEPQIVGFLNGEIVPANTSGASVFELKKTKQGAQVGTRVSPTTVKPPKVTGADVKEFERQQRRQHPIASILESILPGAQTQTGRSVEAFRTRFTNQFIGQTPSTPQVISQAETELAGLGLSTNTLNIQAADILLNGGKDITQANVAEIIRQLSAQR